MHTVPVVHYDGHSAGSSLRRTVIMPVARYHLHINHISIPYVHRKKIQCSREGRKGEMNFAHINIKDIPILG